MPKPLLQIAFATVLASASIAAAAPPPSLPPTAAPVQTHALSGCDASVEQRERLLALGVSAFDRSPDGWRPYGDAHCYSEAAGLIADYVEGHGAALTADDESLLRFHAAQMLADADRPDDAVAQLQRVLDMDGRRPHPDPAWRLYVQGSMAFLQQDRVSLDAAARDLDRFAAGEHGDVQAGDRLNLNALHGLQKCFGRGYAYAYASPDCRDLNEARRLNDAIG